MNGTSGFQEVRSSPPDHQQIGCCASNGIDSEQIHGAFSALWISSLARQATVQSKKRFLTPFSSFPSNGASKEGVPVSISWSPSSCTPSIRTVS